MLALDAFGGCGDGVGAGDIHFEEFDGSGEIAGLEVLDGGRAFSDGTAAEEDVF